MPDRFDISRLHNRLRASGGFTLIETIVVLVIISAMLLIGVNFMSAMFNTTTQANESMAKLSSAQSAIDWTRRELVSTPKVGILNDAGTAINPLSVARDQIVFVDTSRQKPACVRVFYQKSTEQYRAAVFTPSSATADPCDSDAGFVLRRGPNQQRADGSFAAACGAADFDPALDLEPGVSQECHAGGLDGTYTGAFLLADHVQPDRPQLAPAAMPETLGAFTFLKADGSTFTAGGVNGPVDTATSQGTPAAWYATPSNLKALSSIKLTLYVAAPSAHPLTKPSAKQSTLVIGADRDGVKAPSNQLPSDPEDGEEVYLVVDAATNTTWHLRYNAAAPGANKWAFIGGPPLQAFGSNLTLTNVGDSPTPWYESMRITAPVAGRYQVSFGARFSYGNPHALVGAGDLLVAGRTASVSYFQAAATSEVTGQSVTDVGKGAPVILYANGTTYGSWGEGNVNWQNPFMQITPVALRTAG